MLIPDLLNTLFDQSDFQTIVIIASLNKRKTNYANKYSLLQYYNNACVRTMIAIINAFETLRFVCMAGQLKAFKHIIKYNSGCGFHLNDVFRPCAVNGQFEMVKYLTSYTDIPYLTLRYCAMHGNLDMMKYLISIGADIHEQNDVVLREGARYGHLNVVKFIVNYGVDDSACYDALRDAEGSGKVEIVKYLIEFRLGFSDRWRWLLEHSIQREDINMVKYFVSIGVNSDGIEFDHMDNIAIAQCLIKTS
jgi:hypothetical protein